MSKYGRNFIPVFTDVFAANLVFSVTPIPLDQTVVGGGVPIWHFRGDNGDKPGSATTGSHAAAARRRGRGGEAILLPRTPTG